MVVTIIDECAEWNDEKMSWLYEWFRRKIMSENEVIPVKINVLHHDHDERRQFRYGTWGLNESHPTHYLVPKERWDEETKWVSPRLRDASQEKVAALEAQISDLTLELDNAKEAIRLARAATDGREPDDE